MLDDTTPPASSRAGPVLQGASSGTSDQAAWLAVVAATGAGVLAVHAHDADASGKFPAHCLAALRDAGLMEVGALGESAVQRLDLAVRIVAEAGRHCATTAFGLGMHLAARLWGGCGAHAMAGDGRLCTLALPDLPGCLPLPVVHGVLARRVAGGWLLHGRRPLVPMAGVAQCHVVPCTPDQPGATAGDALLLAVDVHAPGVRVEGAWDAMGLRGLDLRERVLEDVFVPEADVLQPEGACARSAGQWPHLQLLAVAPAMGLAQAACDQGLALLRAGLAAPRREVVVLQAAAQLRMLLGRARAVFAQALQSIGEDPSPEQRHALLVAQHQIPRLAQALCAQALQAGGAEGLQRRMGLERLVRDACSLAALLPCHPGAAFDQLGREWLDSVTDQAPEPDVW